MASLGFYNISSMCYFLMMAVDRRKSKHQNMYYIVVYVAV